MTIIYLLLSIVLIVVMTNRYKLHPFIVLFVVALLYGLLSGMSYPDIIKSINDGFGGTLGKIGLIIIFGVIIGAFLENTGGAYRIAEKVLKVVGEKRVPTAMGILGYIVSIPVFADSGFILLSPLNKSLSKKAGISLAGSSVALALGLMATHTLVPPTPGPIAAAGILGADIGLVILLGIPVSAIALIAGIIYSNKIASKVYIDPNPDITLAEMNAQMQDAPSAFRSSLPIFIPILFIIVRSIILAQGEDYDFPIKDTILFLGEPVIALIIGMFLAFLLPGKFEEKYFNTEGWMGKALKDCTTILLITGAGGVFGKVLQNSGIADTLGEAMSTMNMGIWLPFLLAAAIKSAQGSSTVALITTASIIYPMMATLGFDTDMEIALLVIAIGTGSAVVSHANDSFFWVVTQMTGMDVKTGYRIYSLGTLVLGLTGAFTVFLISLLIN